MRETKFKIGKKPWTIEVPYYRHNQPVCTVTQHKEEIVEVHIVVTEQGEKEVPYHRKGITGTELYSEPVFATREEAVEEVRRICRDNIKDLEKHIKFFKKELEELE